jgi:D-inositol-3-phosphate glycosyltransferase
LSQIGMRVAIFNVTTTTQFGGVESFVWEIAARLPLHDVQVDIFGGSGAIRRDLPASVRLRTFPYLSRGLLGRIPVLNHSMTLVKLLERLSFGVMALPTLIRGRYDILHIQKPYDLPLAALVKLLRGTRVLFGCHGTDFFAGDTLLARCADGAVSCSIFNAAQVWEHYQLAPVVVFNGFDPRRFKPLPRDEMLRARFATPTEFLLLYAGRLIRWKGVNYLLDALARVSADAKLVLVGEGEERARLEQQAQALGLASRVFFLGRMEQIELPRFYNICDLVVLPSLMHETFSIVACEALACERAVLGTNIGGIPELVEELVPPAQADALAEKIRLLMADSARRSEIARRGRERVFSYLTWEATTARVFDVYSRLIKGERVFQQTNVTPRGIVRSV